jgi:hypothetical protein
MDTSVLGEYASSIFRVKVQYGEDVDRLSARKAVHRRGGGGEDRTPTLAGTTHKATI